MVFVLILMGCSRGPEGAQARLAVPLATPETDRALMAEGGTPSSHCLRNGTGHPLQFEFNTGSGWTRWLLPPGAQLQFEGLEEAEIRFVSTNLVRNSGPGNAGALAHYRLSLDAPYDSSPACRFEFRPRSDGMLDLFRGT